MSPVPAVPGRTVVRALEKLGFIVLRTRGSHVVMRHPDGRGASVPVHSGRDIPKGTLRSIMADTGLTVDEIGG